MWRYGGTPIFRGTFTLNRAELPVSVFRICAELWVIIEETYRIMGTFWIGVAKIANKSKG